MKILIAYSSITGNTKKVADVIYENCPTADFFKIENVTDFDKYDLIIVGGWIDKQQFSEGINEKISKIKNKKVAFFFTLGSFPTTMHSYRSIQNIKANFEKNGNEILGHYHCMGAISKDVQEKLSSFGEKHPLYPNEKVLKRWEISENHPNDEDLLGAKDFIQAVLDKYRD